MLSAILFLACSGTADDSGVSPWAPDISPQDFDGRVIDNPFLPMPVGATWTYEAQTDEGLERIAVEVLPDDKEVWGVAVTVVRDTARLDGELIEDTWDWYAQDLDGNVWYLGEETCEYKGGDCVDTGGSWEAGVDGAVAGIVMEADPQVGDVYYQEYLAGEAEDMGEVMATDTSVKVPAGTWTGCVRTKDTTALDPEVLEFKTYCAGVGNALVEEEDVRVELVDFGGL